MTPAPNTPTRTIVIATLVKRKTDDGLCEIWEDTPLGKTYRVVLESQERVKLFHVVEQKFHWKEIIWDADGGGWLPLECLKLETK
jgi:hypothetical protein